MYKYKSKIIDLEQIVGMESGPSEVPGEKFSVIKFELINRSRPIIWQFSSEEERDYVFNYLLKIVKKSFELEDLTNE